MWLANLSATMTRIIAGLILCIAVMLVISGSRSRSASHSQNRESTRNNLRLVVQLGHGREGVTSAVFSAHGSLIVTGSYDGTAIVWDTSTGEELRRFVGHRDCVNAVAVSPNDRFVLTGAGQVTESNDNSARLWDPANGAELRRFDGHTSGILSVAFSHDGRRILTGGYDHTARLWDLQSGRELKKFEVGKNSWVTTVAFAPDGQHVALGQTLGFASLWSLETGQKISEFRTDETGVSDVKSLAFSSDGKFLATAGDADLDAHIFEVQTAREHLKLVGHTGIVNAIAFSADGKFVLTGSGRYGETNDPSVRLWDAVTGRELRRFNSHKDEISSVAFSPDGRNALSGSLDSSAILWNLTDGQEIRRYVGFAPALEAMAISPNGEYFLTGGADSRARLWSSASGSVEDTFGSPGEDKIGAVAFSPNGQTVLTGSSDGTAKLWDLASARQIKQFRGPPLKDAGTDTGKVWSVNAVAFSPDGRTVATGSGDQTIRIWNIATGQMMTQFGEMYSLKGVSSESLPPIPIIVTSIAFSPDGAQLAVARAFEDRVRIWNVASGKELKSIVDPELSGTGIIDSVTFSPDGRLLATASEKHTKLWDVLTGKQLKSISANGSALMFSSDGEKLLIGEDGFATVWSVATGKQVQKFAVGGRVVSVAFTNEGRNAVIGSAEGATVVFDFSTGRELCRLISLEADTWVVITPEGRFDTNNLEAIRGLHWVVADTPFKALPIEIFMRDYYEPRLLPRLLKCTTDKNCDQEFKPVRDLTSLNRTQPKVTITSVERDPSAADIVNVTVNVADTTNETQRSLSGEPLRSGAYDLRLFRDGQLVSYEPAHDGELALSAGKGSFTFAVRLGRNKCLHSADSERCHGGKMLVQFSAYAFNRDRVKSDTARATYESPAAPRVLDGSGTNSNSARAYIISIGVNAYENSDWNLKYAANDAREIQKTVTGKLMESGQFAEVVPVSLISDYAVSNKQTVVTAKAATKHNIQSVMDLLAGRRVDAETVKMIPNGDKLRKASPDDLVIISFSSHGYADAKGNFFFIPYDVGEGTKREITTELLQHCISSDELGLWLRDVDAGDIVMIVDACHSAASVQGEGFKPGPMGSRGLGQLSYDKGMRILTSTQSDDVALETDVTRQGLLSFALTSEGLGQGAADFKPKDQTITLAEWLEYGATRVPKLYQEIQKQYQSVVLNELKDISLGANGRARMIVFSRDGKDSSFKKAGRQQPSLFDFTRSKNQIVLAKTH